MSTPDHENPEQVPIYWIGLAEVTARAECESVPPHSGALVGVVGSSADRFAFAHRVAGGLDAMGFDVVAITDIELLSERRKRHAVPQELERGIEEWRTRSIVFGAFHIWMP